MQTEPNLSIVIVNYNAFPYLSQCLDSISNQSFPKSKMKVIVVDNKSNDNSLTLIKKNYPWIKILPNKQNVGFAKANNQAINLIETKYILLLNPDTILSKNTIKIMIEYMENHHRVAISTCRINLPSGEIDDACHRGFPTPWNSFCQFSHLSQIFPKSMFFNGYHLGYRNLDKIHEIDSCSGAFMLIRKEAGDEINWFDEDYYWYGEDIDFCYRIKKKKWKVVFVPKTSIVHYRGISSGIKKHSQKLSTATKSTKKTASLARFEVMKIFYEKHYQKIYPGWINSLVKTGIKLKKMVSSFNYQL